MNQKAARSEDAVWQLAPGVQLWGSSSPVNCPAGTFVSPSGFELGLLLQAIQVLVPENKTSAWAGLELDWSLPCLSTSCLVVVCEPAAG